MTIDAIPLVNQLLREHPHYARQAKANPKLRLWFVGKVLQATEGKCLVNEIERAMALRGLAIVRKTP